MLVLGIPVLNRYDLLEKCIKSSESGTVKPDLYYIIDNGGVLDVDSLNVSESSLTVYTPKSNIGVAASWNKICKYLPHDVIICNDDVIFHDTTIEILLDNKEEDFIVYPGGIESTNSFSCFLIPNKVYKDVGEFDEKISPNYAYFEDNDYYRRMLLRGYDLKPILQCGLGHAGSSTLERFKNKEDHHRRFRLARKNYIKKWGGEPGKELFSVPKEL